MASISPRPRWVNHLQIDYTVHAAISYTANVLLICLSMKWLHVLHNQSVWWLGHARNFLWKTPGHTTYDSINTVTVPPGAQHSKWLPHQAWSRRHPLQSQFGYQWTETHPYTWGTDSFLREPVAKWCHCTSYGPPGYIVSKGWSCSRHHYNRQPRGTC